jgi:predicted nucleic acid-binding protein
VPASELLYVDSSAFVKLVLVEPETLAMVAALEGAERLVASEILEVEVMRATRRGGGDVALAREQLEMVRLLPLSQQIRRRAADLTPPSVRSSDAIHIATALELGVRLDGVYTYDERMSAVALDAGLDVRAPV